jgi:hypothetical protein
MYIMRRTPLLIPPCVAGCSSVHQMHLNPAVLALCLRLHVPGPTRGFASEPLQTGSGASHRSDVSEQIGSGGWGRVAAVGSMYLHDSTFSLLRHHRPDTGYARASNPQRPTARASQSSRDLHTPSTIPASPTIVTGLTCVPSRAEVLGPLRATLDRLLTLPTMLDTVRSG